MIRLYAAADSAVTIVENGRAERTLEDGGARCVAVDPGDPGTVYVGTSDEGLFKSTDGGRSWEPLPGVEHPRVTAVAVSPPTGHCMPARSRAPCSSAATVELRGGSSRA